MPEMDSELPDEGIPDEIRQGDWAYEDEEDE